MKISVLLTLILFGYLPTRPGAGLPAGRRIHAKPTVRCTQEDDDPPKEVRCGPILVRGSEQLTEAELNRLLAGALDNPLDQVAEDAAQADLIAEYVRRGFLETGVAWNRPENPDTPSQPTAILTITEGELYRVRRTEFVGNTSTRDRVIRRRIALAEDSAFDHDLLDLSIKRINQLGIFEEVTRDDLGVEINKEEHLVDLTINLKEKNTRPDPDAPAGG